MKVTTALLTATVTTSVAAHGHHHQHEHLHRGLAASRVDDVVVVPGPTVLAYVLNGQPISAAEVQEGIANGTLALEPDGALSVASSPTAAPTPTLSVEQKEAPAAPAQASPTVQSTYNQASSVGGNDADFDSDSSTGVNTPFPNGQLSCETFPSEYGAINVPWMGLGGWTGIQDPGSIVGGLFSDIMTIVADQCNGVGCCSEGRYCSYACPAGYQKAQWPVQQGSTGQSVGGVLCQNGKLQLTNPSLSNTLCVPGASEVTVLVENQLSQNVAVCRTDYPGTEGETIPLNAQAGSTSNLTCPNAATYYTWEGAHTSAQYYVNPPGVGVATACQWGSPANPWGNYAPLNLGVGYSAGAAWLSIFQNLPTTSAKLPFTVEIQGDNMSGTCRYSNGQYCGGANYDDCSSTTGCTVSIPSGTARFIFSN